MTSAHFFYITIILLVGLSAGFFLGQRAAEQEAENRRKSFQRRQALRKREEQGAGEEGAESAEAAEAAGATPGASHAATNPD